MSRGFTLVEILVVLAILGITAAAVVPALARATEQDDATILAHDVEQVLDRARTTALESAERIDVVFVPETGRYWIRRDDGAPGDSGTLVFPSGTRLVSAAERPHFWFAPTGATTGDSLLALGTSSARLIAIDASTGRTDVQAR